MPISTPSRDLRTLADWLESYRNAPMGHFIPPSGPVLLVGSPVEGNKVRIDLTHSNQIHELQQARHGNEPTTQVQGNPAMLALRPLNKPEDQVVITVLRRPMSPGPHISVGRAPICDVVLPFGLVSKVHAYLSDSMGWTISDAGSTNGTLVNERKLVTGEWKPLRDGQKVSFGTLEAEFWLPTTFVNRVLATRR